MNTDPLVIDGLVKHYPGFTLDLSLRVPRGYVTGFVGANGSGKTTTIKCALGLTLPDAGTVHLEDRTRLGVVLDTPPYTADWTVAATGRVLSRFHPDWDAALFTELTDRAGIPSKRRIKELSRGMGMKLQFAAALSRGANFLVLDEPTSGLDPYARNEFLTMLADFMTEESHTVLFSTHITSDLERIADHIVVLGGGRVIAADTKDGLVESYLIASGGDTELSAIPEGVLIGARRHLAGWDGLVRTEDAAALPATVDLAAPTLDDIVVRFAEEHRHE